ncbi:MAG TPA: DegT/DnrJ/EryC1/StrS family aminotransferase [Stellaceae bacterium]|nr:DegT/DnrJ/EryC1/StrS family aminotransferase [Stellaceae bacterium]
MPDSFIPQTDPRAGYLDARAAIDATLARVLTSGSYILGEEVERFEREFAAYIGVTHAVGVASGTDALVLALRALQLAPTDYVATVSHTSIATVAAIELAGARPLLVDIDPVTMTLDPGSLEHVLSSPPGRVGAIVPVHLYGESADIDAILRLARPRDIPVVEDCAQSHGAWLRHHRLGSFGAFGAFSFYPTKNLGALGDGGMVVTCDAALADRVRCLRQYGWRERHVSDIAGMNSRLDALQAAVLGAKLPMLDVGNARRRAIAAIYDEGLAAVRGLVLPGRRWGAVPVFHQYVVRHSDRDALRAALCAAGIATAIHYPVPIHRQPAYRGRVAIAPGGLLNTELAAGRVMSLPMFPQLGADAARRVVAELRKALDR